MRDERCRFASWAEFYRMKVNTVSIHGRLIALLFNGLTAWGSSSSTDESTVVTDCGLIGSLASLVSSVQHVAAFLSIDLKQKLNGK